MAEPPRTLKIGDEGEIHLPGDALAALELEPGSQVKIFVDKRKKQIRLERHVEDLWGEATKKKEQKDLDELMSEQKRREEAAKELFEKKLKEPPPKRRPEDSPDYWR